MVTLLTKKVQEIFKKYVGIKNRKIENFLCFKKYYEQILIFEINIQIVYILPNCTSQSPAGGDGNLLGHHVRQQQANHKEALRKLAEGSADYFPIITIDAGKNQIQLNYF